VREKGERGERGRVREGMRGEGERRGMRIQVN